MTVAYWHLEGSCVGEHVSLFLVMQKKLHHADGGHKDGPTEDRPQEKFFQAHIFPFLYRLF